MYMIAVILQIKRAYFTSGPVLATIQLHRDVATLGIPGYQLTLPYHQHSLLSKNGVKHEYNQQLFEEHKERHHSQLCILDGLTEF